MRIQDWPAQDRPREKLLLKGEQTLTDAELMAILLQSGQRGKTAVDLARELLQTHGSLRHCLQAPVNRLLRTPGMGSAKCAMLKAAIELGRRYLNQALPPGTVFNHSRLAQQFLAAHLHDQTHEVFACLFLDTHLRLLAFESLFHGTINEAMVYPREVLRRALLHNAVNIILAHNHPSGDPAPSAADKTLTVTLQQALQLVDITVVDHVIIGYPCHFSFADAGLLGTIQAK